MVASSPRPARNQTAYPFLFAIWPALSLYSHNVAQLRPTALLIPLLASLGFAALLFVVLRRFVGSVLAALKTFCVLLALFVGGHLCQRWRGVALETYPFDVSQVLALVTAFVMLLSFWARLPRRFGRLPQLLTVFSAALLVLPLANISRVELRRAWLRLPSVAQPVTGHGGTQPHVFYVVLDGYARADVLRDLYGYDNTPFLEGLRARGCYVASAALANYPQTVLSLASSLNMDYLNDWAVRVPRGTSDRAPLTEAILHSRFVDGLRARGYKSVAFGHGYGPAELRSADRFEPTGWSLGDVGFWDGLLAATPLPDLFKSARIKLPFDERRRKGVLYVFARLGPLAREREPLFVLAHILAPHPPFVFDAEGRASGSPSLAFGDGTHWLKQSRMDARRYRRDYLQQLRYVSAKTLETVDAIRANAARPTVVLLQADHGPGSELDWTSAVKSNLRERLAILSAYCLPEGDAEGLYPAISPVNSFRLLMGRYFGQRMPPLPDRAYFAAWGRPYEFEALRVDPDGELRVEVSGRPTASAP